MWALENSFLFQQICKALSVEWIQRQASSELSRRTPEATEKLLMLLHFYEQMYLEAAHIFTYYIVSKQWNFYCSVLLTDKLVAVESVSPVQQRKCIFCMHLAHYCRFA